MKPYFAYVHNLKGLHDFENFRTEAQDFILSHFLRQSDDQNIYERTIVNNSDVSVLHFISEHVDLKSKNNLLILSTDQRSYFREEDINDIDTIVNLKRVNNLKHPNKLFRAVNTLLTDSGVYIGRFESYCERKNKLYSKFGRKLGRLFWMADFVINRVLPRLPYIDRLYFIVTRGRFRAISLAEVLGRLVYCGFDITDYRVIGNDTYFIATKTRLPSEEQQPSYYPIIKLKRIGQDGKTIGIYKLRTMHPYSEFLQDYIVRHYGYNSLGKPDHDFRVTKWGRLLRKYWIDEIPQCMNLLKGELKLVGLRPLSYCKFQEFPVDLRRKRICFKSGLIPPYVSLCMSDEQGKMDAERIYIQNYTEHRLSADLQFFFKAVRNIMLNKVSSC